MLLSQRVAWRSLLGRCHGENDEAGVVMVLWVAALVGLMVFTAMAVDLGHIAAVKQHAETAVEDAALAAVTELAPLYVGGGGDAPAEEALAVQMAETYLIDNYSQVSDSSFGATSCAGLLPASIYLSPSSDCFGFFNPMSPSLDASNPFAIAVALPAQLVRYSFGRAGGLRQQAVSAVAFASLERAIGASGGFPFAYDNGGGTGLQCLKNGSGASVSECDGFATGPGNFGVINSPRFRIFPGSAQGYANNWVIEADMVLGIDHTLNIFGNPPAGSVQYCDDYSACTYDAGASPSTYDWANYVMSVTGQALTDLTTPMFKGGVQTPTCTLDVPLLELPDGFVPSNSCSQDNPNPALTPPSGPYLDNSSDTFASTADLNGRNISYYLNATGLSASEGCASAIPPGGATATPLDASGEGGGYAWDAYDACLSQVISGIAATPQSTVAPSGQIFDSSIEKSPRFGQVPIVDGTSGSGPEQIVGFADSYLDLVLEKGGNVGGIRAWIFPPGMIAGTAGSSTGGPGYSGGSYIPYLCSYGVAPC